MVLILTTLPGEEMSSTLYVPNNWTALVVITAFPGLYLVAIVTVYLLM